MSAASDRPEEAVRQPEAPDRQPEAPPRQPEGPGAPGGEPGRPPDGPARRPERRDGLLGGPDGQPEGPVKALAKLTLWLRVTGVRADGYHLLESEMVNVDLADDLWFGPGSGIEVLVEGPAGASGHGDVPEGPDNLVAKALALAGRSARARLVKRIPAGAGLGGGSADAAAALRWADLPPSVGAGLASRLGSDVPFCFCGGGRARVSGAGEVVEPLPWEGVAGKAYTLLIPPFGVATGAVYRMWDELNGRGPDNFNDLEGAALRVEPRLAVWRDRLGAATGLAPRLAGSGSTWFVEGEFPGEARTVVRAARP